MTINGFRLGAPDIAYIGAGVTVKGAIVVPDAIVVDGVVEGDVTAQSIRIGPSGAIKGNVISTDVDVSGTLADKADIKEFLLVRASGGWKAMSIAATCRWSGARYSPAASSRSIAPRRR